MLRQNEAVLQSLLYHWQLDRPIGHIPLIGRHMEIPFAEKARKTHSEGALFKIEEDYPSNQNRFSKFWRRHCCLTEIVYELVA